MAIIFLHYWLHFVIQHSSCGWIFGHRWEALDVRTLRGKRLLQLQVIQPLDKGNPTSRQEVIESPDHGRPPLLGLSRRVASCSNALECLRISLSRPQVYPERILSQRWRSVKKTERRHCTLPGPHLECIQITGRPDTQKYYHTWR